MTNPIFKNLSNLVGKPSENKALPNPYARVLALDGGGVRGLITLQTLIALEEITGKPTKELFDLIVATSTGTIIAAALNLGIAAKDLQDDYIKLSQKLFKVSPIDVGLTSPKYDSATKLSLAQGIFGKNLNMSHLPVPTYFTYIDLITGEPALFSSIPASDADDYNLSLAVNGATSPPPYFASQPLTNVKGDKTINAIDGGLGADNPANIAIRIADTLFPGIDLAMLSLGTGLLPINVDAKESQKWGMIDWFTKGDIIQYILNSVSGVTTENIQQLVKKSFVRINPTIAKEHDGTFDADCKNLEALIGVGQQTIMNQCVDLYNFAKLLLPDAQLAISCPIDFPAPPSCSTMLGNANAECPRGCQCDCTNFHQHRKHKS